MDTPLPTIPPVQQTQPTQPTVVPPVQTVPVSDQPLTLDPNQMPVHAPVLTQVAVEVPVQQEPVVPPTPVAVKPLPSPISGAHKERAPTFQAPVSEYLRPSEVTPQLPPEVAEAGIEVVENKEHPQLDDSHKAVGIEHAREVIPVVIPQTTSIYLPYSPAQAKEVEKESATSDSRHWLAHLTEYIIRKFQAISTQ